MREYPEVEVGVLVVSGPQGTIIPVWSLHRSVVGGWSGEAEAFEARAADQMRTLGAVR